MVKFNFFDFLSDTPNTFIFQEEKNKTNFGGVLFLLYIIIMLLISLTYIVNFAINDKYIVDALTHINSTYNESDKSLETDDDLNPYVNFNVTIDSEDEEINNLFVLYNGFFEIQNKNQSYRKASNFQLRRTWVGELYFGIAINCGTDKTCTSHDEEYEPIDTFNVTVSYTGYKLNHEEDIPLQITEDIPKKFFFEIGFLDNIFEQLYLNWEVVIYQDQKSLFDTLTKRKREYIFGEIKNSKAIIDPGAGKRDLIFSVRNSNNILNYYMPLVEIFLRNDHKEYIEYKRIKIVFLDVIANIGALFSTLKFVFSTIFSFYSRNFENYKMVEKILKYPNKIIDSNAQPNEISASKKKT